MKSRTCVWTASGNANRPASVAAGRRRLSTGRCRSRRAMRRSPSCPHLSASRPANSRRCRSSSQELAGESLPCQLPVSDELAPRVLGADTEQIGRTRRRSARRDLDQRFKQPVCGFSFEEGLCWSPNSRYVSMSGRPDKGSYPGGLRAAVRSRPPGGRPGRQPIAAGIAEPVASARERLDAGSVSRAVALEWTRRCGGVAAYRRVRAAWRTAPCSRCGLMDARTDAFAAASYVNGAADDQSALQDRFADTPAITVAPEQGLAQPVPGRSPFVCRGPQLTTWRTVRVAHNMGDRLPFPGCARSRRAKGPRRPRHR